MKREEVGGREIGRFERGSGNAASADNNSKQVSRRRSARQQHGNGSGWDVNRCQFDAQSQETGICIFVIARIVQLVRHARKCNAFAGPPTDVFVNQKTPFFKDPRASDPGYTIQSILAILLDML